MFGHGWQSGNLAAAYRFADHNQLEHVVGREQPNESAVANDRHDRTTPILEPLKDRFHHVARISGLKVLSHEVGDSSFWPGLRQSGKERVAWQDADRLP